MGRGPPCCEKQVEGERNAEYQKLDDLEGIQKMNVEGKGKKGKTHHSDKTHYTDKTHHNDKTHHSDKKEYIEKVKRLKEKKYFGSKTIGNKYSYIYLINQIFGSGIVSIPYVFKSSGWLPCLITNIFICVLTIFNTLLFLRAMTMIPNNIHFNKRYEYISTVCYFLGKNNIFFWLMQMCYYASILASNIISIVIVSHALDYIIINAVGYTVGFTVYPNFQINYFIDVNELYYSKSYVVCITMGYVINAVISIYFSQSNLEDNMKIQLLSFLFLMSTIFQMIFLSGLKIYRYNASGAIINKGVKKYTNIKYPTAFGDFNFKQLLSSYISSYSAVTVIPCWANEMKADVKIIKTVWVSNFFCCFVYYIFGYILCTAYPDISNDNILYDILENPFINTYMKICIYLFDLLTIAPGIYVYCIATRYNLVNSNICSEKMAFILGTIFPFLISWFFTSRVIFENIFTWSSLIFSYACNFITPSIIYLIACKNIPYSGKNPLHHILVLYDPKEHKRKKPIYGIFYPRDVAQGKKATSWNSHKGRGEDKPKGSAAQYDVRSMMDTPLGNSPNEERKCLLPLPNSQMSYPHLGGTNYDAANVEAAYPGEGHPTCDKPVHLSCPHVSAPYGTDTNPPMVYTQGGRNNQMASPQGDLTYELLPLGEEKPMRIPPIDDFIVPIKAPPGEDAPKGEDPTHVQTEKSIPLQANRHPAPLTTDGAHLLAGGGVPSEEDDPLMQNEERYSSKEDDEKSKQNACEFHRRRKGNAEAFEFRKCSSLFNMKANNINKNNPKAKQRLPSNVRKSRKHKTVMGIEKKNKKNKRISIKNEQQECSDDSDVTDSELLNDKIIADMSRDIYNDIRIIKSNYERDEYLIKYSDIFDSFLNLKLMLEGVDDGENACHECRGSYLCNGRDAYDVCKGRDFYNVDHAGKGPSLELSAPNGGDPPPSSLALAPHAYTYDVRNARGGTLPCRGLPTGEQQMSDAEEGGHWTSGNPFRAKTTVNYQTREEDKANDSYQRIGTTITQVDTTPRGDNPDEEEMKEVQIDMPSNDVYEGKLSNDLKKDFHVLINGISNKQNLTWAFDGNKNEGRKNASPNSNIHVNVSNVEKSFHSNGPINSPFRKSKSDIYSYSLNLCKNGHERDDYTDEINGMLLLRKLHSRRNCPIKHKTSDESVHTLLQTKSADNYANCKFLYFPSDEKMHVHFEQINELEATKERGKKNPTEDSPQNFETNHQMVITPLGSANYSQVDVTPQCSNMNKFETFPNSVHKRKGIPPKGSNQEGYADMQKCQSKDRILYFLNSFNRKSKMYKDVNMLSVPDNVYNVIPKINKGNGHSNFDETLNSIFNYYKYNFLLSFSEKNKKRGTLAKYKQARPAHWVPSHGEVGRSDGDMRNGRDGAFLNGSRDRAYAQSIQEGNANSSSPPNDDVASYSDNNVGENEPKKTFATPNSKLSYLNKFHADEKKEPLLMGHQKENHYDELPTINLICPEKPLHGYEDAYQIDDYVNGKINENIIHVYPSRYLRIKHVKITEVLLFVAVLLLLISVFYDFSY
ncbi:amino acid transporter, putative [Plasmodium vivax]|uniref:Amino acid transporter, putative n=1 Tax=Plasmodium vivax TaxID=5855 RepID=A0A1G4HIA0_PLAVI|nr:amino acid transporter, putative [Plasmodium vivax]